MQRGVLQITAKEISEIYKTLDLTDHEGSALKVKLQAAADSMSEIIDIELSEDEVEAILDAIIIPSQSDNENTLSLKKKLQEKMKEFRSYLD